MTEAVIHPDDGSSLPGRWQHVLARLQDDCPPEDPADEPWLPLTRVGLGPASLAEAGAQVAALQTQLALPAGDRVLDLGCGVGRHLAWFLHNDLEAVGVDASPGLCRLATYLTEGAADVWCGDLTEDITPGPFDLITLLSESFGLSANSDRHAEVLARVGRSLAPGGHIVLHLADAERRVAAGPSCHRWSAGDGAYKAVEWLTTDHSVSTRRFALTFNDSVLTYELTQRLYSASALRTLARPAGLALLSYDHIGVDFRSAPDGEDVLAILGHRP